MGSILSKKYRRFPLRMFRLNTCLMRFGPRRGTVMRSWRNWRGARATIFGVGKQNQEKPRRAEQNAALKEVGHLARDHGKGLRGLEARLRSLDMGSEWELMTTLPAFDMRDLTDAIANSADGLETFAQAAEQALRAGKQKSGPRIQTHVQRTVVKLASLYEEFTDEPFSHNPKVLTEYDGKPHLPAGRFMAAFFEIVDPSIQPTTLSTAMARVVKSRRARQIAAAS